MTAPRPLRIVIGMLALAGLAKLGLAAAGMGGGAAPQASSLPAPSLFVTAAVAATGTEDSAPDAPPPGCAMPAEGTPDEMLALIATERALLADQGGTLDRRAAEIALANEALAVETARLEELRQEVEALLARSEAAHVADVDRLVSLYMNMKPRDAAAIMDDLDLEVTVTVLGTMAERNAAPILAALDPVRARALSLILLERSKLPGDRRLDRIRLD